MIFPGGIWVTANSSTRRTWSMGETAMGGPPL